MPDFISKATRRLPLAGFRDIVPLCGTAPEYNVFFRPQYNFGFTAKKIWIKPKLLLITTHKGIIKKEAPF